MLLAALAVWHTVGHREVQCMQYAQFLNTMRWTVGKVDLLLALSTWVQIIF
jgi:hypothetical protein